MNNTRKSGNFDPLDLNTYRTSTKAPVFIILDNLRSALNVGSVFRSADAFRIAGVLLCGISATPPDREIQKTALGATESVEWKYFESTKDAVEWAKSQGCQVFAVEQDAHSVQLSSFNVAGDVMLAFILGNEVHGVSGEIIELCDGCVEIPQFGTKHSLNVAVCAGIVLWHTAARIHQRLH